MIPTLVFGRSIFITRLTAMLLTVLAFIWISLTLRDVFKIHHWWIGGMLLSIAPAWFLHSRTAFETTLMVSFYSGFIYEYLQYREGKTGRLPLALLWGSLAFYSYSPGRVIVVATGLVFLLMDLRHHWRNRRSRGGGRGAPSDPGVAIYPVRPRPPDRQPVPTPSPGFLLASSDHR